MRVTATVARSDVAWFGPMSRKKRLGRRNQARPPKRVPNELSPPEIGASEQSPFATPSELAEWSASLSTVLDGPLGLQPDGFVNVPASPDVAALACRVKAQRAELGVSQAVLARRGGLSPGTFGEIERGQNPLPLPETLDKLDAALGWARDSSDTILRGGVPGDIAKAAADRGKLRLVGSEVAV